MLVPAWPPGAHCLGDERPQPLGAAVDRGSEARRAAAEHDQVEALAVDLRPQAELAGDLGGRGVAQHLGVAHEDRRLLARDLQPVEHRRALRVGVDVVPAHRHQVALEQVAHLERPPRAARGDEPQETVTVGDVPLAARHHRAQDELGHLRPGGEHRPQLGALEGDHVSRLVGEALGDRRLAREGGDVTQERAGVGLGDPDVLARLAVHHLHPAALDDQERGVALALHEQRLAGRVGATLAQLAEPVELSLGHARVHHLVAEVGELLGADLLRRGRVERHGHTARGSRPEPCAGDARAGSGRGCSRHVVGVAGLAGVAVALLLPSAAGAQAPPPPPDVPVAACPAGAPGAALRVLRARGLGARRHDPPRGRLSGSVTGRGSSMPQANC